MGRKMRSKGGADLGKLSQIFEEALARQNYQKLPKDVSKSVMMTQSDLTMLVRRYINWPAKEVTCHIGVSSQGKVLKLNEADQIVIWVED